MYSRILTGGNALGMMSISWCAFHSRVDDIIGFLTYLLKDQYRNGLQISRDVQIEIQQL